jgi:hypothetical protein
MMWGKMTDNYNELSMGYPANISGMTVPVADLQLID